MAARGRDAPIGGQAVLEGVMMRGIRTWSVAVRAPTPDQLERGEREIPVGAIAVQTFPFSSALRRHRLLRLPLVRGVVALGGSLAIGLRALNISANAQLAAPPSADGEEAGDALSYAAFGDHGVREFFTHVRFHKHDDDRRITVHLLVELYARSLEEATEVLESSARGLLTITSLAEESRPPAATGGDRH